MTFYLFVTIPKKFECLRFRRTHTQAERERETHNNQEQQAFSKKGRKLYIAKQVDNCLLCEITGVSSLICDFLTLYMYRIIRVA